MSRAPIPTVVISHQHPFINNFDVLPLIMEVDGIRVLRLTHDQKTNYSYSDGYMTNPTYDLLITDEMHGRAGYRDEVPLVSLPRLPKITQNMLVNSAALRCGLDSDSNFKPVKCFQLDDYSALGNFEDCMRIVAKHEYGARGLAQVVIDLTKVGFDKGRSLIYQVKNRSLEGMADERDKRILELVASSDGAVVLSKGHEKHDFEYLDFIKDISIIQEVVENVTHEYRLLTNLDGTIVWSQERELEGDVFRTATGSNGDTKFLHLPENTLQAEHPVVFGGVQDLLTEMKLGLNSIDLFITAEGKWGIFEYSNQWGIQGINTQWAKKYQETALMDILKLHGFIS